VLTGAVVIAAVPMLVPVPVPVVEVVIEES
jgi:hypothetical protein